MRPNARESARCLGTVTQGRSQLTRASIRAAPRDGSHRRPIEDASRPDGTDLSLGDSANSPLSTRGLSRHYKDGAALDDVTLDIEPGAITGLLGRNGAGKSTLLRIIAGQEFASSGVVRVFGQGSLENDSVLRRLILIREDQEFPDINVRRAIEIASWFLPNWSGEIAASILDEFELPPRRAIKRLSRGMRSALSLAIGLAARADLTLLDEPGAGLDVVARHRFYARLAGVHSEHPRTVVLSTHLVDEVAGLIEHVVILDRGKIVLQGPVDDSLPQLRTAPSDQRDDARAGLWTR